MYLVNWHILGCEKNWFTSFNMFNVWLFQFIWFLSVNMWYNGRASPPIIFCQNLPDMLPYWHTMSKGLELSCELDYPISFWLWILTWKYPHFVEISTFHGYYPHFVEISTFYGYYPYFVYISIFRGDYPHFFRSISHILLI